MDESRGTVEKELALEERMLTAVADLLNRKIELARWPEDVRSVFLLALWKKMPERGPGGLESLSNREAPLCRQKASSS